MIARRHRYVPRCYLKGFADDRDSPQVYVVDLRRLAAFPSSTRNVAQERDFHSLADTDVEADALEKAFSVFESDVSCALERCVATGTFEDGSDRHYILNLIALIAVKNPRVRANADRFRKRIMKRAIDLAISSPEIWERQMREAKASGFVNPSADTDFKKMRAFVEQGYDIIISPADHLITEMDIFEEVLPLFFERAWTVLRAPHGTAGFITSDQPVYLMWSDPPALGHKRPPPGFGRRGTMVLFPLAPSMALVGTFEGTDRVVYATDSQIADFNFAMIENARRQIYAKNADFLYRLEDDAQARNGQLLSDIEILRKKADKL
ncbi:DUF4238 domain-containing protein [Phenylobacterium sp.]|uniref:DUF4238 domain-containing protein n=1 Tax=Phenylobacterium sp. TaxID=1871053 RepID=UPI0030021DBE